MTTTKQHARLLIGLLVLASVLVDLVVLSVVGPFGGPPTQWPHPTLLILLSLAFIQVSLLAMWLVFGGSAGWRRWVGTMLGVAFWSVLLEMCQANYITELYIESDAGTLLARTGIVALAAVLLRMAGGRLIAVGQSDPDKCAGTRQRFQFSIRQMLGWTTALAVTLTLLRCLGGYQLLQSFHPYLWPEHFGFAAIAVAALWATLGTRHWGPWLVTVFPVAATAAMLTNRAFFWLPLLFVLLQALWLLVSLLVVRMAGYRLVWRGSKTTSK